jgi:hybrid polyketide synthase/nonribosomal peptide synthetase ACE1
MLFTSVSTWVVLQLGGQALSMIGRWGPMLTLEQWDDVLKKTDFTGVDTHIIGHSQTQLLCVWVSMARDDLVDLLRERLTVLPELQLKQQQSSVVVSKTMATWNLLQKTSCLVTLYYRKICQGSIEALNDVTDEQSPECSSVCMTELDEPVLRVFTNPKLDGLKTLGT